MGIEIRSPRDDELRDVMVALEAAFGSSLEHEEDVLRATRATMPLDRVLTGWDGGRVVAFAAAWPFRITVPEADSSRAEASRGSPSIRRTAGVASRAS